ncbi:MAG TPA: thiolase family protein [Xanthobacteraceae bacterium]|jgi:acetyl-CoA C-acetyltransferase
MTELAADIVVVAAARTPFGRFEGALKAITAPKLGALAIDETLARSKLAPGDIDALYGGVGMMASAILTPVREAVLFSRLPETVPSAAIDRACCSGMTAIGFGMKDIRCGEASAVLCGGFESLSNTPMLWARQKPRPIGDASVADPLLMRGLAVDRPIPVYSGDEAVRHGIDRRQQDEWAQASHEKYFGAEGKGHFAFERFDVEIGKDKAGGSLRLSADESPRKESSFEKLASLEPVYGGKTITAGNAPGLNDGAAFIAITRRDFAQSHGLTPVAKLIDYVQVCGGPTSGTVTPAQAIIRIAKRNKRDPAEWDAIEINEAYAATPLVSTLVLADGDRNKADKIRARTNTCGGAVAIGHPLGASGARIVMALVNRLRRRGGGCGVAAICGGFGQGDAVTLEVN